MTCTLLWPHSALQQHSNEPMWTNDSIVLGTTVLAMGKKACAFRELSLFIASNKLNDPEYFFKIGIRNKLVMLQSKLLPISLDIY